jgi:uncharacterized protein DUF4157
MNPRAADIGRSPEADAPQFRATNSQHPVGDVAPANSVLANQLTATGAPAGGGVAGVQTRVESVTGYDLGDAMVHRDSPAAARAGVDGLTFGRDVHLSPAASPETAHGERVLAHELAHVVQQGTGRSAGLDANGRRGALEADADAVASQAERPAKAPAKLAPLPPPAELALQLFDPRYHRTSVVEALDGSGFTADEIGAIYASNWERDLSQAHPSLANVILAWKSVKVSAYQGRLSEADIAGFQGACQSVLEQLLANFDGFMAATSYDGYEFYEHMDNPAGTTHGPKMTVALAGKNTSGLPDHMYISREYIKEMLFEAAKLSHPDLSTAPSAKVAASSADTRARLSAPLPSMPGSIGTPTLGGLPPAAVAAETSLGVQAKSPGSTGGGTPLNPRAYILIGRASHALEDFWSHSNFVERAIGEPEFMLGGLTTSTFLKDDRTHALAHKIRGAADEIAAEMPLVDRMAGRRWTDPDPSEVHVGDESPPHHDNPIIDLLGAHAQLPDVIDHLGKATVSGFVRGFGRGFDRATAGGADVWQALAMGSLGGVTGAALAPLLSVAGSRAGVFILRQVAEYLDTTTQKKQEDKGDYRAHGLLAKDQPGHDDDAAGLLKTAKFELAHALSVAADRLIVAKMKGVVTAPSAADAEARLQEIFAILDTLIADATPAHPLWSIVLAHRAVTQKALNDYLETRTAPVP